MTFLLSNEFYILLRLNIQGSNCFFTVAEKCYYKAHWHTVHSLHGFDENSTKCRLWAF